MIDAILSILISGILILSIGIDAAILIGWLHRHMHHDQ
jgi:hypothetical protein